MYTNTSNTQRLRTDLGRSVGVTIATQLVVQLVYGIPTFPLTANFMLLKGQTFKNLLIILLTMTEAQLPTKAERP